MCVSLDYMNQMLFSRTTFRTHSPQCSAENTSGNFPKRLADFARETKDNYELQITNHRSLELSKSRVVEELKVGSINYHRKKFNNDGFDVLSSFRLFSVQIAISLSRSLH